ncbi:MAG: FecR family protein [Planctomycetes bacterium]|nr:FecR family protein [Planctomycetota bacterium]
MNEPEPIDPAAPTPLELERLQRALAPLQWREQAFDPAALPARRGRRPWLLAAAVLLASGLAWAWLRPAPPLQPAAAPRTYVAASQPLTIPLGELAAITLRPGSELGFVHWRSDQALFALRRGSLEAKVVPPPVVAPGFFQVDTPLGRVIDQGCRYTLDLDDAGARIVVTEGAVTFTFGERSVFVPDGAELRVDAGGPRLPCFADADAELRAGLQAFELPAGKVVEDRLSRVQRLVELVQRPRDSLVLWHLLRDPEPECRAVAEERLIELVGTPFASKQESFDPEEWLPFLRLAAWQPPR